jgi:hypothetical protein
LDRKITRVLDRRQRGTAGRLCFLDADVNAAPALITSAILAVRAERIDLLSLAPRQELVSFAERLVLPCGLYLLAFRQDLRQLQARDSHDATATGQFILVRRDAYESAGGHGAVCEAICEDVALARLLKRAGRTVVLKSGDGLVSTRMYTGWRTLWPGVAKNLIDMLGASRDRADRFRRRRTRMGSRIAAACRRDWVLSAHKLRLLRLGASPSRLGHGLRAAFRWGKLFSHTVLVRISVSVRLHSGCVDGIGQLAPALNGPS